MALLDPPLSVRGASITDATGNPVKLCGVNWPGAHQVGLVPAGLDRLHRDVMAGRIKGWGLNHVRLTFAVGTIMNKDGSMRTGLADNARLAANPDLQGRTPWGVYEAAADSLTAAGLAVIPNCQLMYPGWCCSEADAQGLWWNANWPASVFASAWRVVAQGRRPNPPCANAPRSGSGACGCTGGPAAEACLRRRRSTAVSTTSR